MRLSATDGAHHQSFPLSRRPTDQLPCQLNSPRARLQPRGLGRGGQQGPRGVDSPSRSHRVST